MPARERVLTARELNRATFARQLLLRRERVPLVRAVERLAGLQAQEPAAPYVALWSRLDGFDAAALTAAVERRALVKATLMRGTLHLVSAADWTRLQPALAATFGAAKHATPEALMPEITARTLEFARTPRGQAELRAFVGELGGDVGDGQWWKTRGRMPLLYAPTGGPWAFGQRVALTPAPAALRQRLADVTTGAQRLVLRHLAAFGPAGYDDLSSWSRASAALLRDALERLEPRLVRFRDEEGRVLYDLRRAPRPGGDVPAPTRLLGMWDGILLGYADRTRVLDPEHRATVVHVQGDFRPIFLVDGRIAGLWRARGGRVELKPFAPLPRAARRELEDEARRLEAWLAPLDPDVFARYTKGL